MEKDDELKGDGLSYDFGMRMYDNRVGRFFAVDPLSWQLADLSPYSFARNNPLVFIDYDGMFPWPILKSWVNKNGKNIFRRLGSPFGPRNGKQHRGVDMNMGSGKDDLGAPVMATHSGKVLKIAKYTDDKNAGGTRVYIKSIDGTIQTRYMHLSVVASGLKVGDFVNEGDVLGEIGGTGFGKEFGQQVHLHYELLQKVDGVFVYINPVDSKGNLIDPQKMIYISIKRMKSLIDYHKSMVSTLERRLKSILKDKEAIDQVYFNRATRRNTEEAWNEYEERMERYQCDIDELQSKLAKHVDGLKSARSKRDKRYAEIQNIIDTTVRTLKK